MTDLETAALSTLSEAVDRFKPKSVFGLFSGGHDSLTATYIASLHPSFTAAVHINTGIGIEATRDFVRNTCANRNWKLLEYNRGRYGMGQWVCP